MKNVIEVAELRKHFYSGIFQKKQIKAVDGVSFNIAKGETFGLIGESGCGKSTLGRCVVRLLEPTDGIIRFKGDDLGRANGNMQNIRRKLQIIFQDAEGSLNPRMKAIDLLLEPLRVHKLVNGHAREKAAELMKMVNLTPDLMGRYPNELSGGQRQRIGIARAISLNPELIVADEAAASLDLLVQSQMLSLFKQLQTERGTSFLYISHNLNIVRHIADRVAVMYLGQFVETGKTEYIFCHPEHPYTQALLSAIPSLDPLSGQKPIVLEGEVPSPFHCSSGCAFHPRCPQAMTVCKEVAPELYNIRQGHAVACHRKV